MQENENTNPQNFTIRISIFILITLLATSAHVITDIYIPSLPAITKYFQTKNEIIQLTLSVYLFSLAFSQLIYGALSDHFGRRPVLFSGFLIAIFASLLCTFAPTPEWLVVGRFFQGLGMGFSSVSRSILPDLCSGKRLAQYAAYLSMAVPFAIIFAPIIGGYIEFYSHWRITFFVATFYLISLFFYTYYCLPETNKTTHSSPLILSNILQDYIFLLTNRIFVVCTLCSTLALSGIFCYINVSPYLLQNIVGLTPVEYGYLILIVCFGVFIGGYLNQFLLHFFSSEKMVCFGSLITIISGISMLLSAYYFPPSTLNIMAPTFIFVLGSNFILANGFACAINPFREIAGTTSALYGGLQMLGASLSSALIALTPESSRMPLGTVYFIVGLGIFCLSYFLNPKK